MHAGLTNLPAGTQNTKSIFRRYPARIIRAYYTKNRLFRLDKAGIKA